ncbi:MAG TPA: hypothetical protein VFT12_07830, partial [Thermoanaerobaculia bacterium]|nr:hypothetical protein [Thermoanaerobaculia bacterium]
DGRWLAYTTDATGKDEVWLATFPAGVKSHRVSTAGGRFPIWIDDTNEIVYISEDRKLMSARFDGSRVHPPQSLFPITNLVDFDKFLWPAAYPYAVAANGRRFLAAVSEPDTEAPPVQVIVNWPAMLR